MAMSLVAELANARRGHAFFSFLQHNGLELGIFGGIIASALATTDNAQPWLPAPWPALLAALPGVVLLVERQFAYRMRSAWHEEFKTRLRALERAVAYERIQEPEISRQLSALELEMNRKYPRPTENVDSATT